MMRMCSWSLSVSRQVWATSSKATPPAIPNGLPAKLPALDAILPRDMEWIIEHQLGYFEADAMFVEVGFALDAIP